MTSVYKRHTHLKTIEKKESSVESQIADEYRKGSDKPIMGKSGLEDRIRDFRESL
jgi:hypothetical protein